MASIFCHWVGLSLYTTLFMMMELSMIHNIWDLAKIKTTVTQEFKRVHHKQIEDGRIDFNNLPQDIGGEIEDEANSLAGQIIKKFTYKFDGIYE
jgi:hypothetical protein